MKKTLKLRVILLVSISFSFMMSACELADTGDGIDNNRNISSNSWGDSNTGIAGSMARFAVVGDYMYVVHESGMKVFSLSNPSTPVFENEIDLGFGIETIFPYKDKLFIGAMDAMYIFDNNNPREPQKIGDYRHVVACDPVVADDDFAYVTLRSGSGCGRSLNQLHILDITNLPEIDLKRIMNLQSPRGLAISGDVLYVCEGRHGLSIIDVTDRNTPILDSVISNIDVNDIIKFQDIIMLIGNGGFYQYRADSQGNLILISTIEIS